jgi:hypothetical protein
MEPAISEFQRAADLAPGYPDPLGNMAASLTAVGRLDEAITAANGALRLNPKLSGVCNNLGNAHNFNGEYEQAIAAFRKGIEANPNDAKCHTNLGTVYLRLGDYPIGWQEYEWRLQVPEYVYVRNYAQPRWDGSDLTNKTIFLYPEQGLGDVIQFARFIPQVAQRGAQILLEMQSELRRLFDGFPDVLEIIEPGKTPPVFDVHSSLMSLGSALGITASTIPADIPYLNADPDLTRNWGSRFDANDNRLRVGLVWAGQSKYADNRNRSIDPALLARLSALGNVALYSLQKGAAKLPAIDLTDWTADLKDFADTAALIAHLDLVLTVDTAVAHLAGAMGKRVWILLPFVPDWRWMLHRDDSMWYPTARLFRQKSIGNWSDVIADVATALQNEVRQ